MGERGAQNVPGPLWSKNRSSLSFELSHASQLSDWRPQGGSHRSRRMAGNESPFEDAPPSTRSWNDPDRVWTADTSFTVAAISNTAPSKSPVKMPEKVKGTVKWFSNRKGFGFVSPAAGGDDIFLHHSRIVSDADYKTLVSEIMAHDGCF